MWQPLWRREGPSHVSPSALRDRIARLVAVLTAASLIAIFAIARDTRFLMPGPLTSAHSAIKACSTCHTSSGSSKVSWLRGLIAGSPHSDGKACLACHQMPDAAFNPHGATTDVLKQSTQRLLQVALRTPSPLVARAQSKLFPTHDAAGGGIGCATCHQEHQGAHSNLMHVANEQCRSCHVVKFDSFEGNHPQFENYPFVHRTPIIYDHAAHFDKHFPEVAKKDRTKSIPATCATCHQGRGDKSIMSVAPFEQTCSSCHLDQIKGKERASGPKGIAFLTLPGLDVQILKERKVALGEWPDASEAEITPFMRIILSRTPRGRSLLASTSGLNLQDLNKANDDQLKAVVELAWEIKRLLNTLIAAKASDVLPDLTVSGSSHVNAISRADLAAGLPREVILSAQRQWLPHLSKEISDGPFVDAQLTSDQHQNTSASLKTDAPSASHDDSASARDESPAASAGAAAESEPKKLVKRDPPACALRILGQCIVGPGSSGEETNAPPQTENTPRKNASTVPLPQAMHAGLRDVGTTEPTQNAQSDDLLSPTEAEIRDIKAHATNAGVGSALPEPPGKAGSAAQSGTQIGGMGSDVDAESWAEFGGWYAQDYTIYYRPTGHKDRFIYAWLQLTGPQASTGSNTPSSKVFEVLTNKDAQGSCTKCHSIDEVGRTRLVNFTQINGAAKHGRFTTFNHEPHFRMLDKRGCLTCHELEKSRPYLASYDQGNPDKFVSGFAPIKKETCRSCHATNLVRQECTTCHKYHVNGVITPITETKIPGP